MANPKSQTTAKGTVKAQSPEEELRHKPIINAQLQLVQNAPLYSRCYVALTIRRLFLSEEKADCKIICKGFEWNVHEIIVCPRSKYLEAAFAGNFQVCLSLLGSILLNLLTLR